MINFYLQTENGHWYLAEKDTSNLRDYLGLHNIVQVYSRMEQPEVLYAQMLYLGKDLLINSETITNLSSVVLHAGNHSFVFDHIDCEIREDYDYGSDTAYSELDVSFVYKKVIK